MKGKYKKWREQSALSNQTILLFTVGIILVSSTAHLAGYVTIKGIADEGMASFGKGVLPVLFGLLGLVCLGWCIVRRQLLKPLLYLGGAYVGIQLAVSLFMGGTAVILEQIMDLSGEDVKTAIDMVIRVIQIPLRAGGCLFLAEILIGSPIRSAGLYGKLLASVTVYTIFQYLAGFLGTSPLLMAVRVLIAAAAALLFWICVYLVCRKAGEHYHFRRLKKTPIIYRLLLLLLQINSTPFAITPNIIKEKNTMIKFLKSLPTPYK